MGLAVVCDFCDEWCEHWCSVNIILQFTWPPLSWATSSPHVAPTFPPTGGQRLPAAVKPICVWILPGFFQILNENHSPCFMWGRWCVCVMYPVEPPTLQDSSPLTYLPPRQPGHRNRSLLKSFMSPHQKRRAEAESWGGARWGLCDCCSHMPWFMTRRL